MAAGLQETSQTDLNEELIKQWAAQVKRSPVPVIVSMTLIAAMVSEYVSPWIWGTWLFLVVAIQGVRWYVYQQLPDKREIPVEKRIQTVVTINLAGTLLHSVSLIWFPLLTPYQGTVQSILFVGMGVGSVMMCAGFSAFARAHAYFGLIPLFCLWIWSGLFGAGGGTALVLGLIGFGYTALILRISDHVFSLYKESFEIRGQLEVALQKAEAAGRAKTRFLASASHDLRQPIHALSLLSAALNARQFEDDTNQIVESINSSVEALSYELDGLLDISKLDAGIVSVNRTNFCLAALLQRLLEEFSLLAQKRGIRMTFDCPNRAFANTDSILLERILRNLLTNAIQHNTQCNLTLQLIREGSVWRLIMADTGVGIDTSQHDQVFEEFYQLENPERDRSKGLGLGLSIVRRLSDLLDIKMEFESALGQGTQFVFAIEAAEQQQATEFATAPVPPSPDLLRSLVVLVVEDEFTVRDGMCTVLKSLGCKAISADSSDTAVSAATAKMPDIALVDFRLRGNDTGLATIERLRDLYPNLPAIIISGDTAPDRLLAINKANIPLLIKPVLIESLQEAIIRSCFPSG